MSSATRPFTPQRLFRIVAVAEAITWALLLTGMVLKYVTDTTELGVRIGGMVHGVVFVAYCVTSVVVGVDQRWSFRRIVTGLAAAVPPFFTIWFDLAAERKGWFTPAWQLRTQAPTSLLQRLVAWVVRKPGQGFAAAVVVVLALTGLALLVGPPVGK